MMKITFISSSPFYLLYVLCLAFLFCDDHQMFNVSRCGDS